MKNSISSHISRTIIAAAALFLLASVPVAFGQVDTGAILGTVKDTSGAVVPGAKITLTSEDTGLVLATTSGSAGEYAFTPVKIGTYSVSAEFKGFQRVDHPHVTVQVQQRVVVDFELVPGQITQTISVTAEPPALQTQDASVGQVVGARAINDLPLNGRNFTFLAQLAAGVTQGQEDTRGLGASGSFAANGSRPAQNNYLLDGIDNNADLVDFLNGTAYVVRPPVDAIQEFKIQTNDYSAEQGRAAGATLNATIKSGTNGFHGNAWEFLRNDKFDAANFFENSPTPTKKGEYRQNQFGATIGGPIRKDKTFFFGDYEGTRIRQAVPWVATVPTALERSTGFTNFTDLINGQQGSTRTDALGRTTPTGQVFDPATTRPIIAGQVDPVTGIVGPASCALVGGAPQCFAREPFAGNIIPQNRIDPNEVKLLSLFPAPTSSGLFNNYSNNPVLRNNANQFDVRVDQNFSDKDQMFARFSYVDNPEFIPGPFSGIADGGSFTAGTQTAASVNGVLSETHSFSPTMVNEARLGLNRIGTSRLQPFATQMGIPQQFGIQGVPQVPLNGGLGSIFFTGLNTLGSNQFLPSAEYNSTVQVTDNLTKLQGKHSLKGGFELQHLKFSILQPPSGRGTWLFDGSSTEVPGTGGGNTGPAEMLLAPIKSTVPGGLDYVGGSDSISASNIANTDMGRNYWAAYFQDDFKVSPKLTLNLGVRWEYFGQIVENYGAQSNFLPVGPGGPGQFILTQRRCNTPLSPDFLTALKTDNINLSCSSLPGLGHSQNTNFSPRIGFAYQVTPKLVARGGYGIFYGGFENSVVETYVDFPFQFNLSYNPATSGITPITFANGALGTLDTGLSAIVPLTSAAAEPGGVSFQGNDFNVKTTYTQGYNLTLQYQLTPNQTVSAGYVGNTVRHLGVYVNENSPSQLLPPNLNLLTYLPYPDLSTYQGYTSFAGDSYYNSMQLNYERRFSAGLQVLANFTWSKCRTDAPDVLNGTAISGFRAPLLPHFGVQGDYGLCDFDIPHVLHLSGTYALPVGKGKALLKDSHGVANALLGGWQTNWILTLQDGQPFTVGCQGNATTTGFGCIALLVPGQNPIAGPHNVNQWMNPNAFATPPAATTVGQSDYAPLGGAPSQLLGPGFHRLDFAMFKEFQTSERTHLEFRAEFFNLTNHPNFSYPGFGGNGVVPAPGALDYTSPSTFGQISSARDLQNDQREIQFALKFYW